MTHGSVDLTFFLQRHMYKQVIHMYAQTTKATNNDHSYKHILSYYKTYRVVVFHNNCKQN